MMRKKKSQTSSRGAGNSQVKSVKKKTLKKRTVKRESTQLASTAHAMPEQGMPEALVHACLEEMARRAYAPYSKFSVGALVETDDAYFTGCNVENASFGATVCAERVAIWKAVSEGARRIRSVTIYTPLKVMVPPCALCLQVMAEFCDRETEIVLTNVTGKHERYHFEDLLTFPFGPNYLKKND